MQANKNKILLRGRLDALPTPSHVNHGVEYFMLPLAVRRLSGAEDLLHVVAAREQLDAFPLEPGSPLTVQGEVRTFNNRSGVGRRLVVSVFARTLSQEEGEDENRLELSGTLCKPPVLRTTPLGRTICDMILAAATAGPTTSPASPGAAWPTAAARWRWGTIWRWRGGCKAASTPRRWTASSRSAPPLRCPSCRWRTGIHTGSEPGQSRSRPL